MTIRHLPIGEAPRPEPPRIGVVVPATDQVSEVAFAEMLRGHAVSMVVSRVAFENPVVMATLSRMVDDLTRATALLLPGGRIDVVAFSCTSGTVAGGVEAVARAIRAAKPGVPFTTPITAADGAVASRLSRANSGGRSPCLPMASTTRDRPRMRFRSTPSMAVTAPTAITTSMPGVLNARAAVSRGVAVRSVACASASAPVAPTATAATAM